MKVSYYPGCTLKTKAKNLEAAAITSMAALGIELAELPRWNCCGAVHSLADDDLIHQIAPVRDLIRAKDEGTGKLVTLCSMCYNTLARANLLMKDNEEKAGTINQFMDEESDYHGEVEVNHLLNFLQDEIGWEKLREKVKTPLTGFKIASYYGCTLQRPREVGIEPPGSFKLMTKYLEALGATVVDFSAADLCCGSYTVLGNPEAAREASANILNRAKNAGAEALALTCPLCEFNLSKKQDIMLHEGKIAKSIPTFYFTQLLPIALGLGPESCCFELNEKTSLELLKAKKFID